MFDFFKRHRGGIYKGGIAGLRPGEIPVILTRGEHRISREHAAKLGIKTHEESMTERVSPVDAIRRLAAAEDVDRLRLATDIINNHIEQVRLLGHRSKLSMTDVQRMGLAIGMLDEVKPEAGSYEPRAIRVDMSTVSPELDAAIERTIKKAVEEGNSFTGGMLMTQKEAEEAPPAREPVYVVHGPAMSGKTYNISAIASHLRARRVLDNYPQAYNKNDTLYPGDLVLTNDPESVFTDYPTHYISIDMLIEEGVISRNPLLDKPTSPPSSKKVTPKET